MDGLSMKHTAEVFTGIPLQASSKPELPLSPIQQV